jgi:hypothetical protein
VNYKAAKVTTVNLSAARTIESGSTISIFCVVVANQDPASDADVEISDGNGNVVLPLAIASGDTVVVPAHWIADSGISIASLGNANVHVTIFHSQAGG